MSSLFHFEEKIHRKHTLQDRRRVCEATFTIEKWLFVLGAPPLPSYPPVEVDPQIHPPATPAQDPHITMSPAPASDPVSALIMPATHFSPPAPTAPIGPNSSSPPVASIHIIAQDFLSIMVTVCNFAVTSQSFAAAQATMAERMARTEAVLAQNIVTLAQVQ